MANGSKKFATNVNRLVPSIPTFANIHIISPAGAADTIALPNTNTVLSIIDLISIFPTCGFLYGGSSSTNDDGIPFNIVLDNIFEIIRLARIPNIITATTISVDKIDAPIPCIVPAINIVDIVIKNGNLPIAWY